MMALANSKHFFNSRSSNKIMIMNHIVRILITIYNIFLLSIVKFIIHWYWRKQKKMFLYNPINGHRSLIHIRTHTQYYNRMNLDIDFKSNFFPPFSTRTIVRRILHNWSKSMYFDVLSISWNFIIIFQFKIEKKEE